MGHLILDGRFGNEPFPEGLIPFVRMLTSQIAVGLANIRTFEELKETEGTPRRRGGFLQEEMGMQNR